MTLMEYEIFSTTNCTGYQSTDKVLEFRFRPNHSEQDYSEWETLKARYEKQTGASIARQHSGGNTVEQNDWPPATALETEREDNGQL